MSEMMKSFGIDRLTVEERIELAREIWDSIVAAGVVPELTEEQQRELDRRLAGYGANPTAGTTWDDVKARILKRT